MKQCAFLRFDQQAIDALKALGFEIADDNESAKVAGETTVEIIRPANTQNEFWLSINLPNGTTLDLAARRPQLLNAAGIEEEA